MSRTINQINYTDTFEDWVDRTNLILSTLTETVTVKANTAGEGTTGNGYVVGYFGATTLFANTLRGGTLTTSANLNVTSNVNLSGTFSSNGSSFTVMAPAVSVSVNSTSVAYSITSNSTSSKTTISTANLEISSNLLISGNSFIVPVGNTGNRPTAQTGIIRYNTDLSSMETYNGTSWITFATGSGTTPASSVTFANTANVTSNNAQAAIVEVEAKKVNRLGDTMSGTLYVNKTGQSNPSSLTGTLLHLVQEDSVPSIQILETVANQSIIAARRSNGTTASKTQILSGDVIASLQAYGYDGTSMSSSERAAIDILANQNWASGAHGSLFRFRVTPNNSTTPVTVLSMTSVNVSVNTFFSVAANASFSANVSIGNILTVTGNGVFSANLYSNNFIATGTISANGVNVRRAANTSVDGVVAFANTSEFIVGTETSKALQTSLVWASAAPVSLGNLTGVITLDLSTFINGYMNAVGNITFGNLSNALAGKSGRIEFIHSGGVRTLSVNSSFFETSGGSGLGLSSVSGAKDIISYSVGYNGKCYLMVIARGVA